jgi:hypothetical protein
VPYKPYFKTNFKKVAKRDSKAKGKNCFANKPFVFQQSASSSTSSAATASAMRPDE